MSIQSICLRRRGALFLKEVKGLHTYNEQKTMAIAGINKNIESLGFMLGESLLAHLKTMSVQDIIETGVMLADELAELKGVRDHEPLDESFEMAGSDIYLAQLEKFIIDSKEINITKELFNKHYPLLGDYKVVPVEVIAEAEVLAIAENLLSSKTALSNQDKDDVTKIIETFKDPSIFPEEMPLKENVAFATLLSNEYFGGIELIMPYVKTATDVLRIATVLSDGPVNLTERTKFRSFKRSERRIFMAMLEKSPNLLEDLYRYKNEWIRLGERIHPGEFKKTHPRTFKAFKSLRENEKVETFIGRFNALYLDKKYLVAAKHISARPGEFARRLDALLRHSTAKEQLEIVELFATVADKVSSNVLLQLAGHFKDRLNHEERVVISKKSGGRISVLRPAENSIDEHAQTKLMEVIAEGLKTIYAEKGPMGNVYMDPAMHNYITPFSQRSASRALRTIERGSRFPIDSKTGIIRLFCHWHENRHRTDIDLSAGFLDEKFIHKDTCAYYHRVTNNYAHHSGDFTSAPNGATEFIDVDIQKAKSNGIRYVNITTNCYSGDRFVDLKECFVGWMERDAIALSTGETFEPKTVKNRVDLTSDAAFSLNLIIDLEEQVIYFADIFADASSGSNYGSERSKIEHMMKAIMNPHKTSLAYLVEQHVAARGTMVDDVNEADILFVEDASEIEFKKEFDEDGNELPQKERLIITPFDLDIIMGQYI